MGNILDVYSSEEELFPFGKIEIEADSFPGTVCSTVNLHIQEGPTIKFKRLSSDAIIPSRKFGGDAGLDVYALDTVYIDSHSQDVLRTGIALAGAPENCVIQIWSKSGLDARLGLHVGAGIVDPNYRGEILVLLKNMTSHSVGINKGDAIAQLVIVPCMRPQVEIVEELEATDRGGQGGITDEV